MYTLGHKNGETIYIPKDKIHEYVGYRLETRQSLTDEEMEKYGVVQFVSITIPLSVLLQSPELKDKLAEMALIFSDIKRRPDPNGNLVLSNINLADIPHFLTAEEYQELSAVGVTFDDKIVAMFEAEESSTNNPADDETTT